MSVGKDLSFFFMFATCFILAVGLCFAVYMDSGDEEKIAKCMQNNIGLTYEQCESAVSW